MPIVGIELHTLHDYKASFQRVKAEYELKFVVTLFCLCLFLPKNACSPAAITLQKRLGIPNYIKYLLKMGIQLL